MILTRIKIKWRKFYNRAFLLKSTRNFQAWSARDELLNDQFFAAIENNNLPECERIRDQINRNHEDWLATL